MDAQKKIPKEKEKERINKDLKMELNKRIENKE